jgi:hypothetical protein
VPLGSGAGFGGWDASLAAAAAYAVTARGAAQPVEKLSTTMITDPDGKPYAHNEEQAEAAKRGRMSLPTTQPTHADIAWYVRELVLANEHKDDWMAKHYAIQSECAKLRAALSAAISVLDEHAEEERTFWGVEDKHGLAREAEQIYEQAKAALSPPNIRDEGRAGNA